MKNILIVIVALLVLVAGSGQAQSLNAVRVFNNTLVTNGATVYSEPISLDQYKASSGTYAIEWNMTGTNDPVLNGIQMQVSLSGEQWFTNTAVIAATVAFRTNSGENSDGRGLREVTPTAAKFLRLKAGFTNGWGYLSTWVLVK